MTVLDSILGIFGLGETDRGSKAYLVDASKLDTGRKNKKLAPRDQIEIMKRLARFAKAEELHIEALFEGSPLRVAADGQSFNGIKVYYTGKKYSRPELMVRRYKKNARRPEVIVITSDKDVEEAAQHVGASLMSASTFGKALDVKTGGDGNEDRGGRSSRNRKRRPRRRPREKDNRKNESKGPKQDQSVRDLIDLVE